jgi:hypothetical protein
MNQCYNIQVHESKARNLSVWLILSQTRENTIFFLSSLQQNRRARGWNRFCPQRGGSGKQCTTWK